MEMLKPLATAAVLLALTLQWVDSTTITIPHGKGHVLVKRDTLSNRPSVPCNSYNAGRRLTVDSDTLWLCQSGRWQAYKLAFGNFEEHPANSCLEIRDHRLSTPPSRAYYIKTTDSCTEESDLTKVYCNMDDDGGGWILVWKHSAMEVLPLTEDMKYFSDYYKACTNLEVGWCNIPNKARFDPTEMMIAAYHNKRLVFAYKGTFNWNIDKDWTGGYLANYIKVQDKCTQGNGVPPMPNTYSSAEDILGLVFAKRGTYMNHNESYTNDYLGSLSYPGDCRWWDCQLPRLFWTTASVYTDNNSHLCTLKLKGLTKAKEPTSSAV